MDRMNEIELISSIKHPAVTRAKADLAKVTDGLHEAYPIEGRGMLEQALHEGVLPDRVFFREPSDCAEAQAVARRLKGLVAEVYRVTPGVFQKIMGLGYDTSTAVLATTRPARVSLDDLDDLLGTEAIVLVGERIQDPRNVGVLIRNADAWGVRLVILGDSADAYSRAAVRSTTGSVFRVPVMQVADVLPAVNALRDRGFRAVGSSAAAETLVADAQISPPCAVVVGNETVGLSDELRNACDEIVRIPMHGGAHSLNVTVAAGILLYEAAR